MRIKQVFFTYGTIKYFRLTVMDYLKYIPTSHNNIPHKRANWLTLKIQ